MEGQVRTWNECEPASGTHSLKNPTGRQVRTRKECEPERVTHQLESPDRGTSQDTGCEREIDESAGEESWYVVRYSFRSSNSHQGIKTHPERRKGHYEHLYYCVCVHNPWFKFHMGPTAAVHSSHSRPSTQMNIPSNDLLHAELQIALLYCCKHEGNRVGPEFVGGRFNEISTFAILFNSWCTA